ncbi:hypothetical protein F2S72_09190 [Pseudomonas syringae pv. actinidiae]|nr:hypothetical protein [Pseudomonas syringae pv. actinidiae]
MNNPTQIRASEALGRLYEAAHREGATQATVSSDDLRLLLDTASSANANAPQLSSLHSGGSGQAKEPTTEALAHQVQVLGHALGECIGAAGIVRQGVGLTGPELLHFAEDLRNHVAGFEQAQTSYNAVINYILANPCESPMEFLRCWREGSFDSLRNEWPDAPEDVYLADSQHPDFKGFGARKGAETVELTGTKLLGRCREVLVATAATDVEAVSLLEDLTAYLDTQSA